MKENQIKGVLTELVENKTRKSAFEIFLTTEEIPQAALTEKSSTGTTRLAIKDILFYAKQKYNQILQTNEYNLLFKEMANLETTIIQARCTLATEVKLTLVNQKRGGSETSYVVARSPFYNPDNVKAEIRVYLGRAEELGNNLEKLSNDHKFMKNAEQLIVSAMVEVMEKRGVLAGIKKSAGVSKLVTAGEVEEEKSIESSSKKSGKAPKRVNPFSPKHNVKSKSYSMLGLKGQTKKEG